VVFGILTYTEASTIDPQEIMEANIAVDAKKKMLGIKNG
jgi:hypothetical protein